MSKAYKILTAGQWAAWQDRGEFTGAPIDIEDGYIHLSTAEQVTETAAKHFAGLSDLVLAEVDLDQLGDLVRWEPSRGGQLFPHVYGIIPLAAVTDARAIPED
jgi:uncharacterized protein (DUF952 family)